MDCGGDSAVGPAVANTDTETESGCQPPLYGPWAVDNIGWHWQPGQGGPVPPEFRCWSSCTLCEGFSCDFCGGCCYCCTCSLRAEEASESSSLSDVDVEGDEEENDHDDDDDDDSVIDSSMSTTASSWICGVHVAGPEDDSDFDAEWVVDFHMSDSDNTGDSDSDAMVDETLSLNHSPTSDTTVVCSEIAAEAAFCITLAANPSAHMDMCTEAESDNSEL